MPVCQSLTTTGQKCSRSTITPAKQCWQHQTQKINQYGGTARTVFKITYKNLLFSYALPHNRGINGDLTGVGNDLCWALQKLLQEFSIPTLQKKVEAITQPSTTNKVTHATQLYEIIKNSGGYSFDTSQTPEYEYVIDFDKLYLNSQSFNNQGIAISGTMTPFNLIKNGYLFKSNKNVLFSEDQQDQQDQQEQEQDGDDQQSYKRRKKRRSPLSPKQLTITNIDSQYLQGLDNKVIKLLQPLAQGCPSNKIKNPMSGICVQIYGKVGQSILKQLQN